MGEVYRARDGRLGRDVALKILPAAHAADPERLQRFRQEARLAGSLNHPNIVAVFDVGVHDGADYVVSEFVEGETLARRLSSGPLSTAKAVDYAIQAARGLHAAHERGVVHRDIKPDNLMVTPEGWVKIVDFGLARLERPWDALSMDVTVPGLDGGRTTPGTLLGTVAYMSPEQVRGEAVDHLTDIFSLGVVLYEMLAGGRPFPGRTAAETFGAILRDDPPPLAAVAPDLQAAVARCLAKRKEDRFQSARDLQTVLERVSSGAARPNTPGAATAPASKGWAGTIAVLPFSNLTPEADSDYFSDGLTEELIHALTRVPGLGVVAWNSAARMRGREGDVKAVGEQLGVGAVLMGSVRRSGDHLRITARLVDTATGRYLWSEGYDREIRDLLAVQEDIARAIATTLTRQLVADRAATADRRVQNAEAYNLYLKGRFFAGKRTRDGLERSAAYLQQAIAADPRLAEAHSGLADTYCLLAEYGFVHPAIAIPPARQAALIALDLDPRLAEAHASYALIRSVHDWEWDEAEAFYLKSLDLNPGYASAHHWYALDFLAPLGRFEQAHQELRIAQQLDPLSLNSLEGTGYLLTLERRYDEALRAYRDLAELDSSFYRTFTSFGRALSLAGRHGEGLEMLQKGLQMAGEVPSILGALGQVNALAGDGAEARRMLSRLAELSATRYVPSTCFALVHAGLAENDRALTWLEKGADEHELSMTMLGVHPIYDSLRGEARFTAVLRRLRLEAIQA